MQQKTVVKPLAAEMWAIDRIVPYARNPRSNDGAVERMVAAIREFGFKIPLLVLSTGATRSLITRSEGHGPSAPSNTS